jgi:hypothetical protein
MNKRGSYDTGHNAPRKQASKQEYLSNLSSSVNAACEAWLNKRGLKTNSWREIKQRLYRKKQNEK